MLKIEFGTPEKRGCLCDCGHEHWIHENYVLKNGVEYVRYVTDSTEANPGIVELMIKFVDTDTAFGILLYEDKKDGEAVLAIELLGAVNGNEDPLDEEATANHPRYDEMVQIVERITDEENENHDHFLMAHLSGKELIVTSQPMAVQHGQSIVTLKSGTPLINVDRPEKQMKQ